jgi:hypothetical protein
MKYLFIALTVLVLLVVFYLVARRVKPFGQSIAFVCTVLSRINVKLAEYMTKAAGYCHTVCLTALYYPPGMTERDYWSGIDVLSRLVFFVLAVLILAGETVNTLLVLPALFQTPNHIVLPGIAEYASAALFICCPAFFGAIVWECWGKIPLGAGLFLRMGKLSRWILGVIAAILLCFTILVNGYFYLFRAAYLADPQSAQGMVVYILAGLGIEVAAVAPFALWALVVGGVGVVSMFMWIAEQVCWLLAATALFLPSLLDVLAVHLSSGTMSVHGEYVGHDPYKVPALPFSTSLAAVSDQTAPHHPDEGTLFPVLTPEMEVTMSHPDKNSFIGFVGRFGSKMFPLVAQAVARLRATENILASYYLERTQTHVQTRIVGIRDLSHTDAEKNLSLVHGETEQEGNQTLLYDLAQKLSQVYQHLMAVPSPFVHFIDCHELVNAIDLLKSTKRSLPLISQVVITSVSEQESHNTDVQTGMADLVALHAEGVIDTVIVVDPRSPFARHYGEETQLRFVAQMMISLLIAHKHHVQNPAFATVFRQLHQLSPFTAVSFASQRVAVGDIPKRWAWLPLPVGSAGTGSYSDILAKVREATDQVVIEEETCTFPARVPTDEAAILVYNIPLELRDRRFASCLRDSSLYVSSHYPFASSITVSANGCSYPQSLGGRFLVQASCLYPLHTATFPLLAEGKQGQATTLLPVPPTLEPTNGHAHEEPGTQEAQTPPVSMAQSQLSAPARRGRKNTKAEK